MFKKVSLLCLFSALIGAMGMAVLQQLPIHGEADAQVQSPLPPITYTPSTQAPAPAAPTASSPTAKPLPAPIAASSLASLTPEEQTNIAVYDHCNRSVVNINTRITRPDMFFSQVTAEGAGSGSILDQQGHVLTNYHVIEGAREVMVTLFNGSSYSAELVGQDPLNDIAVLHIDAPASELFPVSFGSSTDLRVGQKVFAIGNPFGLERTLTVGILSSINRTLPSRSGRTMKSILQIDAALNQGNSGGPLMDSHARLIGMNTAIASRSGENTGVGFAIPVNTIRRVVPQLIANGRVIRPDIGITRVYETEQGVMIAVLRSGGAAERAGLKGFRLVREKVQRGPFVYDQQRIDRSNADIMVAVDGQPTLTAESFVGYIDERKPGDTVTVTVLRGGRKVDVPVQLDSDE